MKSVLRRKYMLLAAVAGAVVVLDQLTKWLVIRFLDYYDQIPVIPGFFNLIHVHNPGGAFGVFAAQSSGLRGVLFIAIACGAMGLILYLYRNTPKEYPLLLSGLALIFGGALGNLLDRLRLGKVVDFIDLYISQWHWPAFNVADSAITVGMGIFGFYILFRKIPL